MRLAHLQPQEQQEDCAVWAGWLLQDAGTGETYQYPEEIRPLLSTTSSSKASPSYTYILHVQNYHKRKKQAKLHGVCLDKDLGF